MSGNLNFYREMNSLKIRMSAFRTRIDSLQNKCYEAEEVMKSLAKKMTSLEEAVKQVKVAGEEDEGKPGRLHQSDVLLTGQDIQGMMNSGEAVAQFEVKQQDEQTTTILKDAVVTQMSTNLAALLDALGFGKEHVQKHGLDETVYDACLYVQSLKGGESLLNNLRSLLK